MAALTTWLRRLRTALWTAVSLLIVLAAVIVGLGKLFMPYSAQFKPRLEAWLSEEFNQPVRVESFSGEWKAFGPRISLQQLQLLGDPEAGEAIALRQAALDIKPLNALIADRPLYTFRVIGADLTLTHTEDGQFVLSGLGVSGRGGNGQGGFSNLARLGEVRLEDSSLGFIDERRDIHFRLVAVNGRLQMSGRDLALALQASLSDAEQHRVLGDLGATMLVTLDDDQRPASAEWHVETGEFLLAELAEGLPAHELKPVSGRLNAQLWGDWSVGSPQRMEGILDIRGGGLEAETEPLHVDHLNTRFRWRFHDKRQWRLDLADLSIEEGERRWTTGQLAVERNIEGGLGVWVGADTLLATFPMALTQRIMDSFDARWPNNIPRAADGLVSDFDIVIDAGKQFTGAWGRFDNISASRWGRWPDVTGLSGSAELLGGEGTVQFSGEALIVEWPANFRAPAIVDIPACELEILWGARWQVDARGCSVRNESADLQARLRFAQTAGKPFVDLRVASARLDLAVMDDYWPARIMKAPVRDWLSSALEAGMVTDGRFLMRGDMDDFPFRQGEGILDAAVSVEGGRLAFNDDWPAADGIDATVRFNGPGMTVDGVIDSLGGARVTSASARIDDFQAARLRIDYGTRETLTRLAGFLARTPLVVDNELALEPFSFEGEGTVDGRLVIPLGQMPGETQVNGLVTLSDGQFAESRSGLRLEGLDGAIAYTRDGFEGRDIETSWQGFPATLELIADWDADLPFTATLFGRFPFARLVSATPLADDPLLVRGQGEADWRFDFEVGPKNGARNELWIRAASDLAGVTLDLPAPIGKRADEMLELEVQWPLRADSPLVRARLDGVASVVAEVDEAGDIRRGALRLGGGAPELPVRGLFAANGRIERFDLDGWMNALVAYARTERYPGGLALDSVDLEVDTLVLMDRAFTGAMLRLEQEGDVLRARVDSRDLAGDIRYSRTAQGAQSLTAEMERVLMPEPLDSGMSMNTDPSRLPELHIYIQQFRYKALDLGEARIEAFPVADGLRVETAEAASDHVTFQARGDWVSTGDGSRSDFDFVVTSESLGALIEAMDLSSVLEGGQTMVRYDAWWPGPPAAFELAVLNGEMNFSVVDGRILNAEPGAGRVLGLMSVAALPRRLAFDFRDVFASGFSFDQASGTVSLESGMARTDDFIMESPAATLSIAGRSDLVNQAFDYEMTVRPGVSQALPVIGALAAGPTGAAAGLALQGLLRDALGTAAEARYTINGPWEDPEVTRLPAQAAAAAGSDPVEPPGPE